MKDGELGKLYADSEVVFKEGDKGESMYVIQSGKVRITKNTPAGEVTIATLKSGEIFGEMALFDKMPRSANALATGEARVLSIDRKKLFTTISRDPTLVFKIIESMSQRIRGLNEELSKFRNAGDDIEKMSFDVKQTCQMVLKEAKKVIKADNGSLMLLDEDGVTLSIMTAFGKESTKKTKLQAGVGIAGNVLSSGRSELVNNATVDSRFVSGATQINSLLCVPLKYNDRVFGVINMSNNPERLYTIEDLALLTSLSVYSSVVIQNALNFSRLRSTAEGILKHATLII